MRKNKLFVLSFLMLINLVGCKAKVIETHSELQLKYLEGDYNLASVYAKGKEENSRPLPIQISLPNNNQRKTVVISKNKDLSNHITYTTEESVLNVYNLEAHQTYYYTIDSGKVNSFMTSPYLRNLYIDGLTNVRDIGGYKIKSGYTNQGKLIRSSKFSDDYTGEKLISDYGASQIQLLFIKTELDLRKVSENPDENEFGGITQSYVTGLNYIHYPMISGGNILTLNKDKLPGLFETLGNKNNYPIIFHCSIGTDRTGLVAFLINALLEVSLDDIYKDYLFSNFAEIGSLRQAKTIDEYIKNVTSDESKSLKENLINYLVNNGVNRTNIDNLIDIMTK